MPLSSTGRASDSGSEGSRFETWRGNYGKHYQINHLASAICRGFVLLSAAGRTPMVLTVFRASTREEGAACQERIERGNRMVNTVSPSSDETDTSPPWASEMAQTMNSPSPRPSP